MLRILTVLALMATLGMAGVVYKLKYETRELQLRAAKLRQQIVAERSQVAVLKAEWSIFTKPERIDKFARKLGLSPLEAPQIISPRDIDSLPFNKGVEEAHIRGVKVINFTETGSQKARLSGQAREVINVTR